MSAQTTLNKAKDRKRSDDVRADTADGPSSLDQEQGLSLFRSYMSKEGLERLQLLHHKDQELQRKLSDFQAATRVHMDEMSQQTSSWSKERAEWQEKLEACKLECSRLQDTISEAELASEAAQHAKASLQRQLEDSEATNAQHQTEIHAKDTRIATLEAKIATDHQHALEADRKMEMMSGELVLAREQRDASYRELHDANAALATVRGYMMNLKQLEDQKAHIHDAFADLFAYAFDFFQGIFQQDLDDEALRHRPPHQIAISMPQSNTAAAKQMRIVAGLIACAKAITKYLFRRTFLMQGPEMEDILSLLADENPLHEAFLRTLLPKILPEGQAKIQKRCVHLAVDDISSAVRRWATDKEAFDKGLTLLCEKAAGFGVLIQQIEDRVTPSLQIRYAEDWQQLQLPLLPAPKAGVKKQKLKGKNDASSGFDASDVVAVVWPALISVRPDEVDADPRNHLLFHHGYIVTKTQVQVAAEEASKAESLHRVARQNSRTGEPDPRRRHSSFSFLNGDSANSNAE